MPIIRFFWILLWSSLLAGAASVYLAVEGLVDQKARSGAGILAAAAFLIANSIINFIREQSLARRMAKITPRINQYLTSLIGSLGEISADNYHLWKIEFYIGHWRLRLARKWPWVLQKVLIRRASVSIVSAMALRDNRRLLENGPIGRCFTENRQEIWLSPDTGIANPADVYKHMPATINAQLCSECGVMRAVPVTNRLDADCIGVLVVHAEPRYGPIIGGTVLTDDCARRLRTAAVELHDIVRG